MATLFENVKHDAEQSKPKIHPTVNDMEKVQSTLKQIIRDWSKDGEEERAACYGPILKEIEEYFPADQRFIAIYHFKPLVELCNCHFFLLQTIRRSSNSSSRCRSR